MKFHTTTEQISQHFSGSEFACPCCGKVLVSDVLVQALEKLRQIIYEKTGVEYPIKISSGYRCCKHNETVPGAATSSLHTKGMAADIKVGKFRGKDLFAFAEEVEEFREGGIGVYYNRIHVDHRATGKSRWRG